MKYLIIPIFVLFITFIPIQANAALIPFLGSGPSIIPNAFSKINTSNGTLLPQNSTYPLTFVGKGGLTITSWQKNGTIFFQAPAGVLLPTTLCNYHSGYALTGYNQTSNMLFCNLVNATGGGSSGVTSLNALNGALTIQGVLGNTTITSGGSMITVNTAYNIVTTGLAAQIITKQLTLNNLVLGGNANGNSKNFTSINQANATKFYQNGNQVIDTLNQGTAISITGSVNSRTITNTGVTSLSGSNPISVNASNGKISISCSTCSTSSPTTVNGFSPTINIVRQLGNTTIYNNTGTITIGLGINPVITGGSPQIVTKGLTINSLTLGGAENANSQQINSLAAPTHSTDATPANVVGEIGSLVVGRCGSGQGLTYQTSNSTWICTTLDSVGGTVTGSHNGGKATGSVGVLATATSTNIIGRNMTGTSPISITKTNDTDISISCSTCLTSAITGSHNGGKATGSVGVLATSTSSNVIGRNFTSTAPLSITKTNDTDVSISCSTCLTSAITGSQNVGKATGSVGVLEGSTSSLVRGMNLTGNSPVSVIKTNATDIAIGCSTCATTTNANVTGSSLTATDIPYASSSTQLKITKTEWDSGNNAIDPIADKGANLGANSTRFDHVTSIYQNATQDNTNQILFNIIGDPSATKGLCWFSSTTNDTIKCSDAHSLFTLISTKSVINSTTGQLSGNGTGSSSTTLKMDGIYATITPGNTGRITVHVTGIETSSLAGDGCLIEINESTSPMGANGAAVAGSILGNKLHLKSAGATDPSGFSRIYDFSGSVGTKYYFDLAFAAITSGTCTISDVNWDLVEH